MSVVHLRKPTEVSRYVGDQRGRFGVAPICRTLGVSASAYCERASGRRSARAVEDERLLARIRELHAANYYAYGYRSMWKALRRAGEQVPRCRVQRLMQAMGSWAPASGDWHNRRNRSSVVSPSDQGGAT